jgi:hypothetical protein
VSVGFLLDSDVKQGALVVNQRERGENRYKER